MKKNTKSKKHFPPPVNEPQPLVQPPQELKLDLGCGDNKQPGFTGVDFVKTSQTDVVHDLKQYPWPFEDNSVSEVYCSHFFEHLNGSERIKFMEELYRVLKVGGKAMVISPYYSSMRAHQDPTHQWPGVCDATMLYFNRSWREANKLSHYLGNNEVDFDFAIYYQLDPTWASRAEDARNFAIRHYMNVVNDIQFNLIKREPRK